MMRSSLESISRRDRRTFLAGVGIIVALITLSRGVPALRRWFADQIARDDALRQRLALLRDAEGEIGPMRDSLRVRRERLAQLNARLVSAPTPNAAAALLGALIERVADDAEVKVSALELRADSSSRTPVVLVAVRLSAEGDVFGMATFLSAVEGHRQPMVVRTLSASASDPLSGEDKGEVLRFDVTIEGLALVTIVRGR